MKDSLKRMIKIVAIEILVSILDLFHLAGAQNSVLGALAAAGSLSIWISGQTYKKLLGFMWALILGGLKIASTDEHVDRYDSPVKLLKRNIEGYSPLGPPRYENKVHEDQEFQRKLKKGTVNHDSYHRPYANSRL